MKYVIGFGRFWYDFIVGDSMMLAVGGTGVLVVGALLVHAGMLTAAEIALPLTVVATLASSLVTRP
ncbi:MAG: hypothetical protein WEB13_10630 [Dehalococcoidia bacterium]